MKEKHGFRWKMILSTLCFILLVSSLSLGVVYYWSFYHFSNIFEDRVIDEETFQKNKDMGIKNEWILGVTTDSIDVVESIHNKKVANKIYKDALLQTKTEQLYRETIDGKHLLYIIQLDVENGESVYKYSIIKDIYAEIFPQIVLTLFLFIAVVSLLSVLYTYIVSKDLYRNIRNLRKYTNQITKGNHVENIDVKTTDSEFQALVEDLECMKETIENEAAARQNALQYLSHEMKTPLMIIEGYTSSALDQVYPKGDLNETLNTIISQTERMKQRLQDLLTIVRMDDVPQEEDNQMIPILPCIEEILLLFDSKLENKNVKVNVLPETAIWGNSERIKILLENMISNQVKYSDTVIQIDEEQNEDELFIKFYNDGLIIPNDIKDKIFQPFVKGSPQGSGLGLSICKNIMNQMGGKISYNEVSNGVEFVLTFNKCLNK